LSSVTKAVKKFNKRAGFYYEVADFKSQYLERPSVIKIFRSNNVFYILEVGKIVKLLFVSEIELSNLKEAINYFSITFDKNVMYFTSDMYLFGSLETFLDVKKGFFTILPINEVNFNLDNFISESSETNYFNIQLGDKI